MNLYISHISKTNRQAELPDRDYRRLKRCDAVLLPYGWEQDRRCREERATAIDYKKDVFVGSVING